jgi:hypothetical protein
MGQTIFNTKKMKLETKSWVQKTIIGTIVVAILGAGAFGAYVLVDQSESQTQTSSRSKQQASNYESRSSRTAMLPAYAQQNDPFSALNGGKSHEPSQSKKIAKNKSSKGKKVASAHGKKHKKHHGKKYAKSKKHGKHKIAAHKKHGKHKLTHNKHGKKKVAHKNKKHKSSQKLAQR